MSFVANDLDKNLVVRRNEIVPPAVLILYRHQLFGDINVAGSIEIEDAHCFVEMLNAENENDQYSTSKVETKET